jgi:hypothetical protein
MSDTKSFNLPIYFLVAREDLDITEPLVDLAKFHDGIPRLLCANIAQKQHLMMFSSPEKAYRFFGNERDQYVAVEIDDKNEIIRVLDFVAATHDRFVVNPVPGKTPLVTGSIAELLEGLKAAQS